MDWWKNISGHQFLAAMSSLRSDDVTHSVCSACPSSVHHAFSTLKRLKQNLMFNVFSVVEEEAAEGGIDTGPVGAYRPACQAGLPGRPARLGIKYIL